MTFFFCNAHSKEIINFESSCFVVPRNNIYYPEMSCDLEVINNIVKMTSYSQRRKSWCHVWNLHSCSIDKYCMLSCSFEKMIDKQNKLKALRLKNGAECGRCLLGPWECFDYWLLHFCNNELHKANAGLRAHIRQDMNFHWKFSLYNLSEPTYYFYNRSESEWRCITILVGLSEYKGFLINLIHITLLFRRYTLPKTVKLF